MQTAYLPRVTASTAEALTARSDAGDILEDLYRRHLFTHRRPGAEPTYQYHALFQGFLLARAESALTEDEHRETKTTAARLLEQSGMAADALALYRGTSEWQAYVALVRREADHLVAQGRGQTLREWIRALPEDVIDAEPWMSYWIGVSEIAQMPAGAREYLQRAFDEFTACGDLIGQTLAASGMIETYYREMSFFQPIDRWMEVLEDLLLRVPAFDSVETGLRVYSTLLLAIMYRRPSHPTREDYAREVMKALDADIELNTRLTAATFLVSYCTLTCALDIARRLIEKFGHLPSHPTATPINRYWWYGRLGFLYYQTGEFAQAIDMVHKADEIAESHGIRSKGSPMPLFVHYRLLAELDGGDLKGGLAMLQLMETSCDPSRGFDYYHLVSARLEYKMATGVVAGIKEEARIASEAADRSGMLYVGVRSQASLCWATALTSSHEEVMEVVAATRNMVRGGCFSYYEPGLDLVESFSLLRHERAPEAHAALRRAFAAARVQSAPLHNGAVRHCMEHLCAEALQTSIEADFVKRLVQRYRLNSPSPDVRDWPWQVKIFALGRFEVHCNDVPMEFSSKTPKRPLALLKMIVASGADGVSERRVLDALWPDDDGDSAHNAFGVALVRLRKLLGSSDTVLVKDQRLSLNPRLCWVNAWAFERFASDAERRLGNEGAHVAAMADRAVELYRGSFLPSESEEQWTLQARLRLRSRFTRFMETLGEALEQTMQWQRAIDCYYRGLEADDLIEEFYLGLMRCYRARGRAADGIAVFRRMRQTLSVVLNVAPSPAAEALAKELRETGVG